MPSHDQSAQLTAAAAWLRAEREYIGLSPRDLANWLAITPHQLMGYEGGQSRVPSELYAAWARALGLEPKVFAHVMLGFYDPITHDLLFGPP